MVERPKQSGKMAPLSPKPSRLLKFLCIQAYIISTLRGVATILSSIHSQPDVILNTLEHYS